MLGTVGELLVQEHWERQRGSLVSEAVVCLTGVVDRGRQLLQAGESMHLNHLEIINIKLASHTTTTANKENHYKYIQFF